jgi:hypothetical protein
MKQARFNHRILTILFGISLLLSACGLAVAQTTPTLTPAPPEWIMEWLRKSTCSPPCWETIQPGVTSINAIEDIKQKYPYVSFETYRDSTIVRMVSLNLAINDNLPIEILISRFGKPSYVRIYKCDPNKRCETHIIYDDIGMVLNAYPNDIGGYKSDAVDLSADTPLYNIYFLQPGLESYSNIFGSSAYDELISWKDYGEYSDP